jgi:hypothetical protein
MSGFLKRLLIIGEEKTDQPGCLGDWPGYGEDWFQKGKKGKIPPGKEFTLTLEKQYRSLGAFPESQKWTIHKTRRHGPKVFDHVNFSRLLRLDKDEKKPEKKSYQLHYWDYLFCEKLKGWVVAETEHDLKRLESVKNFGGKVGKEGYIYVSAIEGPLELKLMEGEFRPLGLVPQSSKPHSGTFYTLYGHHWNNEYVWTNGEKGGVDGYFQVGAWWEVNALSGFYWALEEGLGFPASAPDSFLKGDVKPFYGEES